jgi:hypothetical protein
MNPIDLNLEPPILAVRKKNPTFLPASSKGLASALFLLFKKPFLAPLGST